MTTTEPYEDLDARVAEFRDRFNPSPAEDAHRRSRYFRLLGVGIPRDAALDDAFPLTAEARDQTMPQVPPKSRLAAENVPILTAIEDSLGALHCFTVGLDTAGCQRIADTVLAGLRERGYAVVPAEESSGTDSGRFHGDTGTIAQTTMTRAQAIDTIAALLPAQITEPGFAARDRHIQAGRILDALAPYIRTRQAEALTAISGEHPRVSAARLRRYAAELAAGRLSIVHAEDVPGLTTTTEE